MLSQINTLLIAIMQECSKLGSTSGPVVLQRKRNLPYLALNAIHILVLIIVTGQNRTTKPLGD